MMKEPEILDACYNKAKHFIEKGLEYKIPGEIMKNIVIVVNEIENNKSFVSALTTSFLKKIIDNQQDIRLHRKDFKGGYSAKSLDTKYTVPFFKKYFPKYANKESAFLTLSLREKIKWTQKEGTALKIRNKKLKESFLKILDDIENNKFPADLYLTALFMELIKLMRKNEHLYNMVSTKEVKKEVLNIPVILEMLNKHFSNPLSSRLPVIAIYSIYEILIPLLERYKNKKLITLATHKSADKHGFGDIEIYTMNNDAFEIVEIKHQIPITLETIIDIENKTSNTNINRYYILTTHEPCFETEEIENEINRYILQIKLKNGMDIIANGILSTLKYYLRFIDDYNLFLEAYTKNLVKDARNSTEVKKIHINSWINILNDYKN